MVGHARADPTWDTFRVFLGARVADLRFCSLAGRNVCTTPGLVGCGGGLRAHREDRRERSRCGSCGRRGGVRAVSTRARGLGASRSGHAGDLPQRPRRAVVPPERVAGAARRRRARRYYRCHVTGHLAALVRRTSARRRRGRSCGPGATRPRFRNHDADLYAGHRCTPCERCGPGRTRGHGNEESG